MRRIPQALFIVATLANSWLLMQAVHEMGHVAGALFTAGQVKQVVLHPLTISRTDLGNNPSPLIVCWAGPVLGAILPTLVWLIAHRSRISCAFWLQFFAGFCLIANGAYLGVGAGEGIGDAGDLVRYGAPLWTLYAFAVVTAPLGFWLWNGLGARFGLGPRGDSITWRAAGLCALLLIAILVVELIASPYN